MGVVRAIPASEERSPLYMPILAALSSLVMCLAQNRSNVLQSEQNKVNQWGTLVFSVALSLYLGLFVSKGVAFYWICSNLLAVAMLYLLNAWINPKKYIDYEALARSREELEKVEKMSAVTKHKRPKELVQREKADLLYDPFYQGFSIDFQQCFWRGQINWNHSHPKAGSKDNCISGCLFLAFL